jgi:hypothetical protein
MSTSPSSSMWRRIRKRPNDSQRLPLAERYERLLVTVAFLLRFFRFFFIIKMKYSVVSLAKAQLLRSPPPDKKPPSRISYSHLRLPRLYALGAVEICPFSHCCYGYSGASLSLP